MPFDGSHVLELARTQDGRSLGVHLRMANRHGLIAGATGTGKTVTVQKLSELFSDAGVPVMAVDVKGDLMGLADASISDPYSVRLWDPFGDKGKRFGIALRDVSVRSLSRLLELNPTQASALYILFAWARSRQIRIESLCDVQRLTREASSNLAELRAEYGFLASVTLGAIQRQLFILEEEGALEMFSGPPLSVPHDMCSVSGASRGIISLIESERLVQNTRLYGFVLCEILNELFRALTEVGDTNLPRLALFIDEAHLLFSGADPHRIAALENIVRLIRSKGVSLWFVTQSPSDIPNAIANQLGHRVQHALRASTPEDHRLIRALARGTTSTSDYEKAVKALAVGECLYSGLVSAGSPLGTERVKVLAPRSLIGKPYRHVGTPC